VPTKAKFLVVDDCRVMVDAIADGSSPCASEIRKAYDGAEAVTIAKEFHPDCVVTGYAMPRMNGLQEAVAILQFLPQCKFVFFTSNAHNPSVREAYERLGFDPRLLIPKSGDSALRKALALAGFAIDVV
jgi:two-component system, OmpR family, alkaline phosphatase synthesis response regulator PhoP